MNVIIASKNPIKISCVQDAFGRMFPNEVFEFQGIDASSDVSDQPMSENETIAGAKNRVLNAKKSHPDADYWVGIEGGIELVNGEMSTFA